MRIKYTDEQIEFLKNHIRGFTREQTIEAFNTEFGIELTGQQVITFRKYYHIPCGIDCTFKKGQPAYNKGVKWSEEKRASITAKQRESWFKPGGRLDNVNPIGTVRWRKIYYMIKVGMPKKWISYAVYLYEQAYGPLKKDQVIFCDGDRRNLNLDNLMEITNQECLYLNRIGAVGRENIEAALLQMKLEEKIREVEGHRCKDCIYYEKLGKGFLCHEEHHKNEPYKFCIGKKCIRFIARNKDARTNDNI